MPKCTTTMIIERQRDQKSSGTFIVDCRKAYKMIETMNVTLKTELILRPELHVTDECKFSGIGIEFIQNPKNFISILNLPIL